MDLTQFPPRKCREPVWNAVSVAYNCELNDMHTGPCMSSSVQFSVTNRDRWEKDNPELAKQQLPGDIII